MSIQLRCVERGHAQDIWQLSFDATHAIIVGPKGETLTRLTPAQAASVFQLPTFGGNTRHFGLRDGQRVVLFDVSKEDLASIRTFLDTAVLDEGPEGLLAVKARATRDILIGAAAFLGGTGISIATYIAAANNPAGGRYYLLYGLPIYGLIMLVKGIQGLRRFSKLNTMC